MHGGFSCHSKALYIEQYIKENYKKATLSASGPTREATSINGRAADVTNKVANPTPVRTPETLRGMNLTDQCRRELKQLTFFPPLPHVRNVSLPSRQAV